MTNDKGHVTSLAKGLSILKTLSNDQLEMSLMDIVRATGMSPSTSHRYLSTLVSLGYVAHSGTTRMYRLTLRVLELGFASLRNMTLRKRVLPCLLEVSRKYNITTGCSVLDGADIVYIERVRSTNLVHLDLTAGSRLPAYATSMGKVMLAFQNDNVLKLLLKRMVLTPITPHTITDKEVLRREFKKIRKTGYATCRQELSLGIESIAAPVFNENHVEAAISFNLPTVPQAKKEKLELILLNKLLELARGLSIGGSQSRAVCQVRKSGERTACT